MDYLEVRAYLSLAARVGGRREIPFRQGMTVQEVASGLGIADEEVGLILLNGCRAEADAELKPGDRIAYFPEYVPFHKIYGMCVL